MFTLAGCARRCRTMTNTIQSARYAAPATPSMRLLAGLASGQFQKAAYFSCVLASSSLHLINASDVLGTAGAARWRVPSPAFLQVWLIVTPARPAGCLL